MSKPFVLTAIFSYLLNRLGLGVNLSFFFFLIRIRSVITMGLPLVSQHSQLVPSPLLVLSHIHTTIFAFLPILAISSASVLLEAL